jgi:hypothetical protein
VQTLTIDRTAQEDLTYAMHSLEVLLNENDPSYIINAIRYYNAHKKLDKGTMHRINELLSGV